MSFVSHLECSKCAHEFSIAQIQTVCPDCDSALWTRYDLRAARASLDRDELTSRPRGMWRWRELLPISDPLNEVTLGEGDSPTLHLPRLQSTLKLENLFLKDESTNPTGTFKARGMAAAVSRAKEFGFKKVIVPTAGNAGGAMAAYAARANMQAAVFMPKDTPRANIEECRITGAQVTLVDGLISDAAKMAGAKARAEGWFDLSTFKEPNRLEGKKVMGYEIAEYFDWHLPDVIIYPTGGGTGLAGIWKAFAELAALGWLKTDGRPRMVAVQADGCAPVVKAFHAGAPSCEFWPNAQTKASGLRVPKSFADHLILTALRESNGTAISVSDEVIFTAQRELATQEGLFAAPEGAATFAALKELVRQKWIQPEQRVLLLNTGSGLKYLDA